MSTLCLDDLVMDGVVVARADDFQQEISERMHALGLSQQEAWEHIKVELRESERMHALAEAERNSKAGSAHAEPLAELIDGNVTNLAELPECLRFQGGAQVDTLSAIHNGSINLLGEHPLSALLSDTVAEHGAEEAGCVPESVLLARQAVLNLSAESRQGALFPNYPPQVRITASDFARTSLFHATGSRVPRRMCSSEKLGQIGGRTTTYYTGEELRMNDQAIFRQILFNARNLPPWSWIKLSTLQIRDAKGQSWNLGGNQYEEVMRSIFRMRSGLLMVQNENRKGFVTLNLIDRFEGKSYEDRRIRLDPKIALLFDAFAAVSEAVLKQASDVATKIYEYIASVPFKDVHPILIVNMFELCYGARVELIKARVAAGEDERAASRYIGKKLSDFTCGALPKALQELRDRHGVVANYFIEDGKVRITKNLDAFPNIIVQDNA